MANSLIRDGSGANSIAYPYILITFCPQNKCHHGIDLAARQCSSFKRLLDKEVLYTQSSILCSAISEEERCTGGDSMNAIGLRCRCPRSFLGSDHLVDPSLIEVHQRPYSVSWNLSSRTHDYLIALELFRGPTRETMAKNSARQNYCVEFCGP